MWMIGSCAGPSVPQTVRTVEDYSHTDDAAKYRPQVDRVKQLETQETPIVENQAIESQFSINAEMQTIVDSMYVRNDTIRLFDGYTILVYSGNNEIEAGKVRNRLFDLMPEEEARFSYKLPTYFVKIGKYFQQLEAAPTLKMIQETYPAAAIVPEKFPITRTDGSGEN